MIGGLIAVGLIGILLGFMLLLLGIRDSVTTSNNFGKFGGSVGAVSIILGLVMMGLGASG